MWLWRPLTHGLRALMRRRETDQELDEEVQHFLREAEAELIDGGAAPQEARRAVRLRYGEALGVREEVRSFGWEQTVEVLQADLRYSARRLRRSPGFTAVVVLTLGLGVGAATAIFTVVNSVLFEPLPFPRANRVMAISDRAPDGVPIQVAFGSYRELSQRSRAFEALSVFKPWEPALTGRDEPERLEGLYVSAAYFEVLGVVPVLGRGFDPADDHPGGPNVVVLSDALWRRRFAADPTIVGQGVRLDDGLFRVVGVMAPTLEAVPGQPSEAWSLLQYDASLPSFETRDWGHHLDMIGRLRPDIGLDDARRELDGVTQRPVPEFARPTWASMELGLSVRPLREATTAAARPTLLAMLGAAGLLLTISCVNVANLWFARVSRRRGELAMRTALGAGRGRLARQFLVESLLLAGLGGALGLAVAQIGIAALVALSPPGLPRAHDIALDGVALGFVFGISTMIGVAMGLATALAPAAGSPDRGLRDAARRTVGTRLSRRRGLVVAEVALALILLVGAGLLLRSMQNLQAISPGFDTSDLVVIQVQSSGRRLEGGQGVDRVYEEVLRAVRQEPGVRSATLTNQLPLSGDLNIYGVTLSEDDGEGTGGAIYQNSVAPGYFETMVIPIVRGRPLQERDISGAPKVVVVSESLASRAFPGLDPIGRRLQVGNVELPPYTVVGVVGDVKQASLGAQEAEAAYMTTGQWYVGERVRWLVVRADRSGTDLVPGIKRAIWSVDPNQPIIRVDTMDDVVTRSEAQRGFALLVFEAFAVVALVLAAIGLYGVLSGGVTERMRELGVRSALGATRENILALVLRQGMTLTGLGLVIGLAGAAVASKVVTTLLFGVSRVDPITYLVVASMLASVSAIACWIPASRAARVDPISTLRAD